MSSTGIGVIGLGFMGQTHVNAYNAANDAGHPCHIAAVCDQNAERLLGHPTASGNIATVDKSRRLFDPDKVLTTSDPAALFAHDDVELVSICTHTESHVDLAVQALEAGKNVIVEKPVAVSSAEVKRVCDAADASGRYCMPAMCMRFWPGWTWLQQKVADKTYGDVRSAVFQRLARNPMWAHDFYGDLNRSGGALFDLHVHDVDFVTWLFGVPDSVSSVGSASHVTTQYGYANGPNHVVAEGGWDHAPGFDFRMRFVVIFEEATVDFALQRPDSLVLYHNEEKQPIEIADGNGYDGEIRHMIDLVAGRTTEPVATIHDAYHVTRVIEAERRSVESGQRESV